MFLIILFLFSISLVPENLGLDFTLKLRPLIFATLISGLILQFGFSVWRKDAELKNSKFKFVSIDVAYFAAIFLAIISFITKAQCINAFHFVFIAIGMFVVYAVIRVANSDEILLQSKIIYSVVGIGFIVAVIGLIQFVMGKPIVSTFGRTSYLGCFLAMNVPVCFSLLLATRSVPLESNRLSVIGNRFLKLFALLAFVVILGVTLLTKSRSAMIALAVVLPLMIIKFKGWKVIPIKSGFKVGRWKNWSGLIRAYSPIRFTIGAGVAIFILTALFFGGKIAYKLKPMSASGRVLIWKVSAEMFKKNPISGVGFGNFANSYNLYQAGYFVSGKGTIVNKMTAGQIRHIRHAYNWYLETAAEFGFFGLVVFGIFWWLILVEIFKTFKPHKGHKKTEVNYLNLGMSGAVLCFMIMSLFQFPRKIIPTYLMFNFALAWIVNANLEENNKNQIINNK